VVNGNWGEIAWDNLVNLTVFYGEEEGLDYGIINKIEKKNQDLKNQACC